MMLSPLKRLAGNRGAVLLEFVMCFPILLVIFLFVMQLAQILVTWQVVHYAAYMGARSAMVTNNIRRNALAEQVVKRILAVVSNSPSDSKDAKDRASDDYAKLPGWGYLPGTKYLDKQVSVDVTLIDVLPTATRCTVKFKMFLLVPVAGNLISFFAKKNKTQEEEEAWKKKLDQQAYAMNPALLATMPNTIELDKGLKLPYIELTSEGMVHIPYGTKYYPIY